MLNVFSEAPISLFIILINILTGLYSIFMDESLMGRMAFRPKRIRKDREYYRFITAGFVHAGLGHLAFNLITFFYFGPYLELRMGSAAFILVYFGSLLTAHGAVYYAHRNDESYSAVGASGAISGILFAFSLFNPFRQIVLFGLLPIPAWLFAIGFVALSIYAMKKQATRGSGWIAHEAHLGGALGGLLLTIMIEPRSLGNFLSLIGL